MKNHKLTPKQKATDLVDDSIYSLRDNAIFSLLGKGETKIHEMIRNQELFEYTIIDREDFIETLIGWISEATQHKEMMKQDLFMLQEWDDEYILSSISTNEYIRQEDSNFNQLCEELLALNESIKDMRAIKVTYSNGDTICTSMAKSLTDDEMLNYFSIGKWFNLGSVGDNMQQVTKRQILR